ncbi:hypothetical protein AWC12_12480 [Mycolicibacterium iranicum]|uniref:DUF3263 domain-containing protein n=2 Tax=Mycolicibacterium iranicum TaxID=912594 RepID=A0A1X1WQ96_MYCIR|nr:hypothetical protein AWC12_12480 [Mycolicibacterium iranicum]
MSGGDIPDRFTHDIVTFMRSWAPYGGPPADEVLPEFGLTRDQLIERYHQILARRAAEAEQARRKPWLALRRNASLGDKAAPRPSTTNQ